MTHPQLNGPQFEAVQTTEGPLLVLAGAGSGKTRILTYRIAHMIESGVALPGEILSLTFTNKAARVMKERVERLLSNRGIGTTDVWISTFHSMGAKLLRLYGGRVGLEQGFTIFDDSDQLSLIKDCMEKLGLSDKVVSPKAILHKISALKNDALDPREFQPSAHNFFESKIGPVVRAYEAALRANNSVDFGDLILRTLQLFREDPSFSESFQERYRYLLVDEYQDTNAAQYHLLREMTRRHRNLCVVGDEDQSIYRWRGADIHNILDFEKDFPDAKLVKLEENYRSSGHIIRAANRVIANNKLRKEKKLFTSRAEGPPIEVHFLDSDFEESRFVVRKIQEMAQAGKSYQNMAVFYRTNAQSRLFEDRLRYERIPYRIFGGQKFYERAEIKDALCYLRLFVNPRDEVSLLRIINVPTRGIGRSTLDAVREFARQEGLPLLEAVGLAVKGESPLGSGPKKKLGAFLDLYAKILAKKDEYSPVEFYAYILDETGYLKSLEAENSVEAVARLENLKELGSAISEYEARTQQPTLENFLEEVALLNDADKNVDDPNYVSLMTLHSAKGLEFEIVFLGGLEEELFPSIRPDVYGETDSEALEEERRLCYVGITRAEHRLYLSSARTRRVFGVSHVRVPSRFLQELPQDEIQIIDHSPRGAGLPGRSLRLRGAVNEFGDFSSSASDNFSSDFGEGDAFGGAFEMPAPDRYRVGVKVSHPDYGEGTVVGREGQNEGLKVTVRFTRFGTKKFVVRFAPLEVLS